VCSQECLDRKIGVECGPHPPTRDVFLHLSHSIVSNDHRLGSLPGAFANVTRQVYHLNHFTPPKRVPNFWYQQCAPRGLLRCPSLFDDAS
jgi:hypothetical protein